MATTPFTSEWEWLNINRGLDYTVVDGASLKRNNWTLVRSRYSNAPYVSELDTKLTSLTAYNGGVPETIPSLTGIDVSGVRFDTTTTYTLNTTTWIDIGRPSSQGGVKWYRQESSATNIPDSDMVNILGRFWTGAGTWPDMVCVWAVVEMTSTQADSLTFSQYLTNYTNYARSTNTWILTDSTAPTIDGETIAASTATGTFSPTVDSDIDVGTWEGTGSFLCTADTQNYQQRGVEWYQQLQTWSFKDDWRTA